MKLLICVCLISFLMMDYTNADSVLDNSDVKIDEPAAHSSSIISPSSFFKVYHKNFFVVGEDNAKFQISFKWNLIKETGLHFGYTQLSFWDVFKESSPFREVQFTPELFYRFKLRSFNFLALDLGLFEHTSNGRDGDQSRSYDQSYIRLISGKKFSDGLEFLLINRFYYIYSKGEANRDIDEFLGFYEISLKVKNIFKFAFHDEELHIKYVPGKEVLNLTNKQFGLLNIGISFNLESVKHFPTFLIDYYSGTAETLIDYENKDKKIRFGITKNFD